MTTYKREYKRQEGSKSSGSGSVDVYVSNWEYFNSMAFVEATCNVDDSINTIDEMAIPPSKKRKIAINTEQNAKAELWKAIANSLTSPPTASAPKEQNQSMQSGSNLCDRAQLFGRTVADSLMQCDANDWPMLKKKIMDLFFDYEQGRRNNAGFNFPMYTQSTPTQSIHPAQQQSYASILQSSQMPYSPFTGSNHSNESYTS